MESFYFLSSWEDMTQILKKSNSSKQEQREAQRSHAQLQSRVFITNRMHENQKFFLQPYFSQPFVENSILKAYRSQVAMKSIKLMAEVRNDVSPFAM